MQVLTALPANVQSTARQHLNGERVLWADQPDGQMLTGAGLGAAWYFYIPWTAFAVFWMTMASKSPSAAFPLFGLPFVLIGIWGLSKPFIDGALARHAAYILTDRRLLILKPGLSSVSATSISPSEIISVTTTIKGNGRGSVALDLGKRRDSDGAAVDNIEHLHGISNPAEVQRLLAEMKSAPVPAR